MPLQFWCDDYAHDGIRFDGSDEILVSRRMSFDFSCKDFNAQQPLLERC
jgi:1,4-alpha-glucan branching enzyme